MLLKVLIGISIFALTIIKVTGGLKMTDQELKDLIASLAVKTDEELNKLKEAQLKTDEQLKKKIQLQ